MKLIEVRLSFEELLILDGKINDAAQKVIDDEKKKIDIGFEFDFMNEVILSSLKIGYFNWNADKMRSCNYCDKKRRNHVYDRTSRNHNKGDINYDKPIYYYGVTFNTGFITIAGSGLVCNDCEKKYNVINRLKNYILDNNLPIELKQFQNESKYKKDDMRICYQCMSDIYESEMGKLPAMFGGLYPGKCPRCGAESLPFGKSHESTSQFRMILTNPPLDGIG